MAWGGYVAPTGGAEDGGFLFGATHDRGQVDTAVRDTDSERNRAQLAERLPLLAQRADGAGARAAVRATTRDRLPVCGPVPDTEGLFVLGGLGSRGFCVAPLLGEHLAAILVGAPSPLPADLANRVLPGRFDT